MIARALALALTLTVGGLMSTGCGSTKPTAAPPVDADAERVVFVGRLTENVPLGIGNPSAYCLEDGQLYRTATHRMDDLNVFGVAPFLAVANLGPRDVVAVTGRLAHGLDRAVERVGPCPPEYEDPEIMQMRSDWTSPECGFDLGKSTKAKLAGLDYVVADGARKVTLVEVLAEAPTVRVRVDNPFDTALEDVTVVWHYETMGKGKPMGHEERSTLTLAANASEVIEAEAVLTAPEGPLTRRGGARLEWVELRKADGPVRLKLITVVR